MKLEAARLLVDFSNGTLTLREHYNGRNWVSDTSGVIGEPGDFYCALGDFIRDACDQGEDDCELIAAAVRNLREDGMGRERIWY